MIGNGPYRKIPENSIFHQKFHWNSGLRWNIWWFSSKIQFSYRVILVKYSCFVEIIIIHTYSVYRKSGTSPSKENPGHAIRKLHTGVMDATTVREQDSGAWLYPRIRKRFSRRLQTYTRCWSTTIHHRKLTWVMK